VASTVALRPLLTKQELADLLRCSPRTVDRLRRRGVIAAVKFTPGGRVAFRRQDVERLLAPSDDELMWR
jgi:excisionase family DNA binding protein